MRCKGEVGEDNGVMVEGSGEWGDKGEVEGEREGKCTKNSMEEVAFEEEVDNENLEK